MLLRVHRRSGSAFSFLVLLFCLTCHVFTVVLWSATCVQSANVDTSNSKNNNNNHHQPSSLDDNVVTLQQDDDSQTISREDDADDDDDDDDDNDDDVEDSFFDPLQADPDCQDDGSSSSSCWSPPSSTIEEQQLQQQSTPIITMDASCSFGGDDPDANLAVEEASQASSSSSVCPRGGDTTTTNDQTTGATAADDNEVVFDKHWGSDKNILRMRNKLRDSGSGVSGSMTEKNRRPPVFLMPGLASTRLVAWRYKACPQHPLLSDIKVLDYVWLNINLMVQMGTIDASCLQECLSLGINQTDTDDFSKGCKLRPDEGLDAISSLSPGGLSSNIFVGGTNTVYSWLIQWLSDNLGYDVSSMLGFPYDWRLSPDKMEERDGFLTLTRRRIEAAVQSNGEPGILVAHSMGNLIFRYFLLWLRNQLRKEAFENLVDQVSRRIELVRQRGIKVEDVPHQPLSGWLGSRLSILDELITKANGKGINDEALQEKLKDLAKDEGDVSWRQWIDRHVWTYVGLSAPLLGAVNPLRSVISGENMGIPITDAQARVMELTFGSTHTVNPMSMANAFCDEWSFSEWDEEPQRGPRTEYESSLSCLDDIANEISEMENGWDNFPALNSLLKERKDWDSEFPMIEVILEDCGPKEKSPCTNSTSLHLSPRDAETGELFTKFSEIWKEKDNPLVVKREQLRNSFWETELPNILNMTWDRPPIRHVIMAYGVDIPTEIAYTYRRSNRPKKKEGSKADEYDGVPDLDRVLWETAGGILSEQKVEPSRGGLTEMMKKPKRKHIGETTLVHSGDGSVPYLSLSYAHTWLLHALRARAHESNEELGAKQILDSIDISHRPKGGSDWLPGFARGSREMQEERKKDFSDTGTAHPHGTRYKPEMLRYHTVGTSRVTGQNYSTTVIEAIGVEHKETTRNYDILAAVFTDVLRRMHDDFDIV